MKIRIPNSRNHFELPDEWLHDAGMASFVPNSSHYSVNFSACSEIVPISEIESPFRENGKLWFRDRESVVDLLTKLRDSTELDPIEVWSKEKKASCQYIVKDGFHRFYLCLALGYREIPIKIDDFDMYEFFEKERKGLTYS